MDEVQFNSPVPEASTLISTSLLHCLGLAHGPGASAAARRRLPSSRQNKQNHPPVSAGGRFSFVLQLVSTTNRFRDRYAAAAKRVSRVAISRVSRISSAVTSGTFFPAPVDSPRGRAKHPETFGGLPRGSSRLPQLHPQDREHKPTEEKRTEDRYCPMS